jgi:transcriptional regulator with XRE-family HTH domain
MEYMKPKPQYQFDKSKLRTLRKSRKMTLEDAATIMGVAKAQLHQWEKTGAGTVRSLLRISAAYGVNPSIFFIKGVFQTGTPKDFQE